MPLLTTIRLFFASFLLRSPSETDEAIDMSMRHGGHDLESGPEQLLDNSQSFHSRDATLPQRDKSKPCLEQSVERGAPPPPIQTTLNAYIFPSYPLTLYLAKKPANPVQTGTTIDLPHVERKTHPIEGKVMGVRGFDEGWVEFVVEYGEEQRRDSLMVPLIWAKLSGEEQRLYTLTPLLKQPGQGRVVPDTTQQHFSPYVSILSDLQGGSRAWRD
ncbi:hypothetical protein BC835DRAFT_1440071 [Cytidiella melzeri]|nr:hypothetical protein BC835DRAFT_1440071 [Cytidiella melzeri]